MGTRPPYKWLDSNSCNPLSPQECSGNLITSCTTKPAGTGVPDTDYVVFVSSFVDDDNVCSSSHTLGTQAFAAWCVQVLATAAATYGSSCKGVVLADRCTLLYCAHFPHTRTGSTQPANVWIH